MLNKNNLIAIITTIIAGIFIFIIGFAHNINDLASEKYQVYLDGEKIGLIDNADNLYSLRNLLIKSSLSLFFLKIS